MQGQRSTVDSLPETFEFDHGSSSNNSGFDQQIYWNNILNQVETQNLPNYLISPPDENMSYMNTGNHEDAGMSIWSPGGPSSSAHPPNLGRHDETKMEHEWTSLTINAGGGPTIEQRRFNTTNTHSLENLNMNLNTDQDAEHSLQSVDTTCEASESGLRPNPMTGVLRLGHYSSNGSLNTPTDSTIGVGFMSEDVDDRSSVDARRLACKRKNIEGFPGQSSTSGGTCFFQPSESGILRSVPPPSRSTDTSIDLSSSSDYPYGASSSEEQLNPRISTIVRGMTPDCYPSPSVSGNTESSHRNFRLRTNDLSPPNLFMQGNISRRSGVWSPNQPSPLLIPFNHSQESRPVISESQRHMQIIHGLPRHTHSFPWSGTSDPRVANSSNPLSLEERSNTTRDETSSRTMLRNNFQEQAPFVPTADMRHLVQDPTNWNLVHGHINMNENVAPGINPVFHSSAGPAWAPHQNLPSHHHKEILAHSRATRKAMAATTIKTLLLFILSSIAVVCEAQPAPPLVNGLNYTFYESTCPNLEAIVRNHLQQVFQSNLSLAAGLLRLHFHDCFVQGCDASVLLDGSASGPSEQSAPPNLTLRAAAFKMINELRDLIDTACGLVVSCADVVALAARDSVFLSGGPNYMVPLGRRDGLNFATQNVTLASLPAPTSNVTTLLGVLNKIGLDTTDLVTLSGGHTIGLSHCTSFTGRLYPTQDPTMDNTFANNLKLTCPANNTVNTTVLDIRTPNTFDNMYYVDLLNREGLFTSDQDLYSDSRTSQIVTNFAFDQALFFERFGYSMVKMGMLSVLTGNQGEIRANCSAKNSNNLWSIVDGDKGESASF